MYGIINIEKDKIKVDNLSSTYSELANIIGVEAVLKIHSKYRGTQIFFPLEIFSKDFIVQQIINEYNGHNVRELATKYEYTEKWIRKIIRENINQNTEQEDNLQKHGESTDAKF